MKANNYKTKNLKYKDNIEKIKNDLVNEYGINIDSNIRNKKEDNYSKIYKFNNK